MGLPKERDRHKKTPEYMARIREGMRRYRLRKKLGLVTAPKKYEGSPHIYRAPKTFDSLGRRTGMSYKELLEHHQIQVRKEPEI